MKNNKTKKITIVGLLTALVFVSNYISIPIPTGFGVTRVHIANGICILAAMLVGPLWGGLAAGLGSMFYDFTNPAYIAGSPITFIFKFTMAAVAGLIVHSKGAKAKDSTKNIIGTVVGALTYVCLYLIKSYITQRYVAGIPHEAVMVTVKTKAAASLANAAIGVIIALVLNKILKPMVDTRLN